MRRRAAISRSGCSGSASARTWTPGFQPTYVQARYTYGWVEKVAGVKHDRTNANLEIGTFITPRWSVSAYGSWQWAHGGIDVPIPQIDPLFPFHDRLAADEYFNLGLGTGWSFTPSVTTFLIYSQGVHGKNGHKIEPGAPRSASRMDIGREPKPSA